MTQLHDLRHGRKATSPMQPNDLVLIGDADYCHINRVVAYGDRNRLHFIEQVTAAQAQAIVDTGGEWCEECQAHLATEIVDIVIGEDVVAVDFYRCPACIKAERALTEQRSANAQAVDIALHGGGPRRDRRTRTSTESDFLAMTGRM